MCVGAYTYIHSYIHTGRKQYYTSGCTNLLVVSHPVAGELRVHGVVARLPPHHETSASDVFAYLLHATVDCDFGNLVVDVDNFTTSASAMR